MGPLCSAIAPRPRKSLSSTFRADGFLNFIVISDEEENQFQWCRDEYECQPLIQADPAFENCLGETANPDT